MDEPNKKKKCIDLINFGKREIYVTLHDRESDNAHSFGIH